MGTIAKKGLISVIVTYSKPIFSKFDTAYRYYLVKTWCTIYRHHLIKSYYPNLTQTLYETCKSYRMSAVTVIVNIVNGIKNVLILDFSSCIRYKKNPRC